MIVGDMQAVGAIIGLVGAVAFMGRVTKKNLEERISELKQEIVELKQALKNEVELRLDNEKRLKEILDKKDVAILKKDDEIKSLTLNLIKAHEECKQNYSKIALEMAKNKIGG
ncbi:MAG: hypothetical protein ACRC0V_09395 [Fusobacteriaceae bacterium]